MNIGNNNDDNFDDMTFDDMTFDDMPLDNDIEMNPNNDMNNDMNNGMGSGMNNGMNNGMGLGQQNMNLGQQNMNMNMGMNQQNMGMNMNQQIPNNKKAKKAKKEKVPKQPKQKAPKKSKRNKVVNMNDVVTNEDNANSSKGKVLFIVLGVLAVVVIIAIALFMNRTRNGNKHIIIADNTQRVENTEVSKTVDGIVVGDNSTESTESNDTGVIKLKKPMKIALTVNTKTEGETEYSDHETYIEVEYSDFVAGYDNVKKYLDEYNEDSTNKINLPDKEEFYNTSKGNDLVMYEVKVTVPKDFPTNDEKHGYTGLKPKFTLGIKGTEKEDALITKLYEFAIPTIYNIGDDTTQDFTIGQTYTLRYMVTMPTELSKDDYKLTLNYSNDDTNNDYTLESVDIPSNADAKTK